MLERRFPGKLREILHDLDEYHLAKILLGAARRPMRPHEFRHQRIESANQFARRIFVLPQRRGHQLA